MNSTVNCYTISIDTDDMPNKHLDHLEDLVFFGRREVTNAVNEVMNHPKLSVKWDGAPAIVFGTDPRNGKFFVGTKSVFNKIIVKICYDQPDIDTHYKGCLADILRLCLHHLPRIGGIVQADFIGVSGGMVYRPNVLEYRFNQKTHGRIVLAAHTAYTEISPDAIGYGGINIYGEDSCQFLGTNEADAQIEKLPDFNWIKFLLRLARCKIPTAKARPHILKHINKFIRAGRIPRPNEMYDSLDDKYKCEVNLTTFKVWYMLFELKERLLENIKVTGSVSCYIDGEPTEHEGFVTVAEHPVKIVDRLTFSKANFNLTNNWTNEKL